MLLSRQKGFAQEPFTEPQSRLFRTRFRRGTDEKCDPNRHSLIHGSIDRIFPIESCQIGQKRHLKTFEGSLWAQGASKEADLTHHSHIPER